MFPMASEDALDLLKHLLVFNPAQRYSAADALAHRYVTVSYTHLTLPTILLV